MLCCLVSLLAVVREVVECYKDTEVHDIMGCLLDQRCPSLRMKPIHLLTLWFGHLIEKVSS